jgi:hypothetical protein
MSSITTRLALLAGLGMLGMTAQAAALGTSNIADTQSAKAAKIQVAVQWQCMTDDGYGRKLPCSMGYKAANPNWKGSDACHVKHANGKTMPCSAATKAKFQK